MHFSTLAVSIIAVAMATAPAFSAPDLKDESTLTEADVDNDFELDEFMLPDFDIAAAANEFTPPEGLLITTITTLPDMTEGHGGMLMTMVTAVGVTSTEPVVPMLPTATAEHGAQHPDVHDHGAMAEGMEDLNMETGPVSLPVFTYTSLTGSETVPGPAQSVPTGNGTAPNMSTPTNSLVQNGTIISPSENTNRVTLITSATPTATNGTVNNPTPPALSNTANGVNPILLSVGAFLALGLAILAL